MGLGLEHLGSGLEICFQGVPLEETRRRVAELVAELRRRRGAAPEPGRGAA